MSTPTHDQFIFLHEDEGRKVLSEFKSIFTDEIIREFVNFIRGCGHHDECIYKTMKEMSEIYFSELSTEEYLTVWDKTQAE